MPFDQDWKRRAYAQKHYIQNKTAYVKRAQAANKLLRIKAKRYIREVKAVPCADCELTYPYYVMQFDHVAGEKMFNIGTYVANGPLSMSKLLAEVAKCEVVCANCHAERTYQRGQLPPEAPGDDDEETACADTLF